ncbi:hypothetical protein HFN76_10450 [Rhizobium laguerreae]|nr:hypothetical protein [Rhizobium laguerreae]
MPREAEPMRQPLFFGSSRELVVDTSVIINLNATGQAGGIIRSLNVELRASTVVRDELIVDRIHGRDDSALAERLVSDGLLQFVELNDESETVFESLVSGAAEATLDDGEAATLALAACSQSLVVIDERKAIRVAGERFPSLELLATADLLQSELLLGTLGRDGVTAAVFSALTTARMGVLERHHGWIVDLLGDRIVKCRSLPASLRGLPV